MATILRYQPNIARWTFAAFGIVVLLVLSRFCFLATERRPVLGLRAEGPPGDLTITWVQPAGLAWDAGVRPGDLVRTIDGNPMTSRETVADVRDARAIQVQTSAGSRMDVAVDAAEVVARERRWSFLTLAAALATVGSAIWVLGTDLLLAGTTWAMMMTAAVALIAATATPFGAGWVLALEFVALYTFAVSVLAFFLVFPINRLQASWARWVLGSALGVAIGSCGWYLGMVASDSGGYVVLQHVGLLTFVLELGGASLLAGLSLIRASPARRAAQRALGLVAFGATVGLLPFCLLVLLPDLLGDRAIMRPDLAILSLVLLPASLGNAVIRHQFPGITRLVRRGVVALVVWTVLIAASSAGFVWVVRWEAARSGAQVVDPSAVVVLVTMLVAGFWSLQAALRRVLEQRLFHDVYDYRETLHKLSIEIAHLSQLEAIASHILSRVGNILDLSWARVRLDLSSEPVGFEWDAKIGVASGAREPIPSDRHARTITLVVNDETVGELIVGAKRHDLDHTSEDLELLTTLAPLMATALQNALLVHRLEEQVVCLTEREGELARLSTRLMRVQEEERRSLALDLHDDPLQRAIMLARELRIAKQDLEIPEIGRWAVVADDVTESLRAICMGLRPSVLDDVGLVAGLEWLVTQYQANSELTITLSVATNTGQVFGRLDEGLEIALYRIAQEALNNCVKHAQATTVMVELRRECMRVVLTVTDDGRGMPGPTADKDHDGIGLIGMRQRLKLWGGQVRVSCCHPHGVCVTAEVFRSDIG